MTALDVPDFRHLLASIAARAEPGDLDWLVKRLPPPVMRRMMAEFFHWRTHGGQAEPDPDWRIWLLRAGRGFGKTLVGSHWVTARARETPGARIALVGGSRDEVVKVMIEGPSGLLAVARADEDVVWMPTDGVVSFPSGAQAFVYSAAAPEKLRGPEHDFAWCDELAKWGRADAAWDNLMMGMRRGTRPRTIVTTTPRLVGIMRRIRALKAFAETRGRMDENVHLEDPVRDWAIETYGGTRLGRQELDGELFDEPEFALFPRAILEEGRVDAETAARACRGGRIVIGVDPPASAAGNACGIVVCGLGADPDSSSGQAVAYVLADCTVRGLRPEGWARAVAKAADRWGADRVIVEQNQGGEMVESVLRSVDADLPVRPVSATQSKSARAEPVASWFETKRARLGGRFPELEDELAGLTTDGYEPGSESGPGGPGSSPDRADAMVWAMSALIRAPATPRVRGL